jgi:hypothetical protein
VRVGDIPRFALMPTGEFCSTTYYYRDLRNDGATATISTGGGLSASPTAR